MRTAYISHPECLGHDTGESHPECARRLSAIEDRFISTSLFDVLRYFDAPEVTEEQLLRVHRPEYLEFIRTMAPASGYARLDPDTVISRGTLPAARRAAGAAVLAVDLVMAGEMESAFCCVRPPGHHAESGQAMGFCLYNNIAVGVAHALQAHGVTRAAIVDFDVHQGNGTEEIFSNEQRVLFCSTFQHPFFPFTPLLENTPNRVSIPLDATAGSKEFRSAVKGHWLPALENFSPEIVFISAGFDAHRDDDMSQVSLTDQDYRWVTEQIVKVADNSARGRVISVLEGGYELNSLARCADSHVRVLMGLH
ncbi:MAG: histone deacetylase family protein [Xanthomonadales bacterium]|nr:histone deacetylase family protein [Gammaproteobacteria bacterium]MBT8054447.1 histone deacetylase family protein [Gammaproteobacteria bacterium]NND58461.1 histone deacetylase family protein [Xanthomonadales bacterium]NNK50118.1 histone deacetylase family protein [Xanthomonadales bacterium]